MHYAGQSHSWCIRQQGKLLKTQFEGLDTETKVDDNITQDSLGSALWGYANPPSHKAGALANIPKESAETRTKF